jgi:uncharacterized membrane protein
VFPAVIHSVPRRFGAAYSADLTGYHMGGAFGFGYIMQMSFGYVAVLTGYEILPFVLLILIGGVFAVIPLLGALVAGVVNIAGFVLDIMGAVSAYQGSTTPLPIVGDIHLIG